jgi:hypothetical protein
MIIIIIFYIYYKFYNISFRHLYQLFCFFSLLDNYKSEIKYVNIYIVFFFFLGFIINHYYYIKSLNIKLKKKIIETSIILLNK